MNFNAVNIQTIEAEWLNEKKVTLDVLRLDKLHEVVSGNKWFKLKYYLEEAVATNKETIATFGGAYSNHIIAVAFACYEQGLKSVGVIRGERPIILSETLTQAEEHGMKLMFITREEYRNKEALKLKLADQDYYWIDEGGYGKLGALGASEIGEHYNLDNYTHIIAAVGTGTMLSGLLLGATSNQHVIGISAMKGNESLQQQVLQLTGDNKISASLEILHNYHFGGFGKHPKELIDFMNKIYEQHHLPLDIVYTGKTFYAIKDLVSKNNFAEGAKLVMIHSGGLQGNRSLGAKVLAF